MTSGKPAPVTCTHMADGHSKAVLSVFATEDLLFTSSKGMYTTFHVWQTVILIFIRLQSVYLLPL